MSSKAAEACKKAENGPKNFKMTRKWPEWCGTDFSVFFAASSNVLERPSKRPSNVPRTSSNVLERSSKVHSQNFHKLCKKVRNPPNSSFRAVFVPKGPKSFKSFVSSSFGVKRLQLLQVRCFEQVSCQKAFNSCNL